MALNQDYFANILQTCLDEIQSGQAGFDEVLARYPDLAAELKPQLEIALWLQSKQEIFAPSSGFLQNSQNRIQNIIRHEAAQQAKDSSNNSAAVAAAPRLQAFLLRFALAFVLVLAVIAGAGGVAFAARDTLPGDTLYPVKRTVERVQLAFTVDPVRKAGFQIQLVERRMMEVQALIIENRFEDLDRAVRDYESQVEMAVRSVNLVAVRNPDAAVALASELQQTLTDEVATLNALASLIPAASQDQFERLLVVSEAGITAAGEILYPGGPTPIPTEGVVITPTVATATFTDTPVPSDTPLPPTFTLIPALPITVTPPTYTPTPETPVIVEPVRTQEPTVQPARPTAEDDETKPTKKPKPTRKPQPTKKVKSK